MRTRIVAALAWILVAPPGLAAEPNSGLEAGAPVAAAARYAIGRAAYRDKNFEAAAREFRSALDLFPSSPKLAYNLARTLERLAKLSEAADYYDRYLELSPEAEDRASVKALVASLRARVREARPEVAFSSVPEGAAIFVDGAVKAAGQTPLVMRLEPGTHAVRFEKAGYAATARAVDVESGRRNAVVVEMTTVASTGVSEPADAREDTAPTRWRPVAGWVTIGLGAAAVGVGAWSHARARETADEADGLQVDDVEGFSEKNDELDSRQLGAQLGYGFGAALVIGGAALLLWPAGDGPVAATIAPGTLGFRARW